jgi:hypothetical protein
MMVGADRLYCLPRLFVYSAESKVLSAGLSLAFYGLAICHAPIMMNVT